MSDRLLGAESIAALLEEVAEELAGDPGRRVVVVGGALLALHGLREATRDVDSITASTRSCVRPSPVSRYDTGLLRSG